MWNRLKRVYKKSKNKKVEAEMPLCSLDLYDGTFSVNGMIIKADTQIEAITKYRKAKEMEK